LATARRVPSIPDVPSIAEALPGFDASVWHGVVVPKGAPAAAVKRLNAAFNAVLKRPQVRAAMEKGGIQPVGGTPEEFAVLIKSETAKYEKLLKEMGMAGSSKL
jgi:tripartite-type tricarboxylate transporter receptor subunit TctC